MLLLVRLHPLLHVISAGFLLATMAENGHLSGCVMKSFTLKATLLTCACRVKKGLTSPNNGLKKLCLEGRLDEALELVDALEQEGEQLTTDSFYCLLQGCINKRDIARGRKVHLLITKSQWETNAFLGSHLIRLFDTCKSLSEAKQVFKRISEPNVFAWSAIISVHAKLGEGEAAIDLYHQMQRSSVKPDKYVFIAALKACSSILALRQGKLIHSHIIKRGFEADFFVGSILIDVYSKCGSLIDARQVLDGMQSKDVVLWNAMIAGYAQHGHGHKALELFKQMQQEGVGPNDTSFICVLKACSTTMLLGEGMMAHASIIQSGFASDLSLNNTLIDMYAKCGSLGYARHVFEEYLNRDVVTWNAMITGYAQNGFTQDALILFDRMQQEGFEPNNMTWNTIIAGHAQHGHCQESVHLFHRMRQEGLAPDIVTWNTFLAGLAQHGHNQDALWLFHQMLQAGIAPSKVTFVSTLKACSNIAAIHEGQKTHSHIIESALESDMMVAGTLIDMYANCGSLEHAMSVFNKLQVHNVVTWSALIAGFTQHSHYTMAVQLFENMQREGYKPNEVTFVSILSACSHAGLVDEGYSYFELMQACYGITPTLQHYNCVVDLLGAAGYLFEAHQVLLSMPFQSNIMGWTSLLSHCRKHRDMAIAKQCFERAVAMDCRHAAFYIMMSNIYSDAGMWEDAEQMMAMKSLADAQKTPGKAFIEIRSRVHDFTVGDKSHPRIEDSCVKIKSLDAQLRQQGFVPHVGLVLLQNARRQQAL